VWENFRERLFRWVYSRVESLFIRGRGSWNCRVLDDLTFGVCDSDVNEGKRIFNPIIS
jgi:hypothetical protein